ncbi:hypothetical protein HID58_076291, partial [Brassica napus]
GKRHADDRRDTCIDAELTGTGALKVITLIARKRSSPELRPPEDEAVNTTSEELPSRLRTKRPTLQNMDESIKSSKMKRPYPRGGGNSPIFLSRVNRRRYNQEAVVKKRTMKREESRLRRCFENHLLPESEARTTGVKTG